MRPIKLVLGMAAIALVSAALPAKAETPIKFSLDWKFEGTQAPFLVGLDKGYFKAEGLDVRVDTSGGSVGPINRIASGTYGMAFAEINSMMKFREQNRQLPLKAGDVIYSNPRLYIVDGRSRGK